VLLLALCHGALHGLLLPREGYAQGGLAAAGRRDELDAFLYVPSSEGVWVAPLALATAPARHFEWTTQCMARLARFLSERRRSALRGD